MRTGTVKASQVGLHGLNLRWKDHAGGRKTLLSCGLQLKTAVLSLPANNTHLFIHSTLQRLDSLLFFPSRAATRALCQPWVSCGCDADCRGIARSSRAGGAPQLTQQPVGAVVVADAQRPTDHSCHASCRQGRRLLLQHHLSRVVNPAGELGAGMAAVAIAASVRVPTPAVGSVNTPATPLPRLPCPGLLGHRHHLVSV